MNSRDEELEEFKTKINLTQFMAAHGFQLNQRKSTQRFAVMRSQGSKTYLVSVSDKDKHWVYKNPFDVLDKGSIIDFCKAYVTQNLGEIRKYLRPWVNKPPQIHPSRYVKKIKATKPDIQKVLAEYMAFDCPERFQYLESRKVTAKTYQHSRVMGRIKLDSKGKFQNIIFPHYNEDGVCGYEIKGRGGFSGFSKQGLKGAWVTKPQGNEKNICVFESVVDALSFAELFPERLEDSHFMSVGGNPSSEQRELVANILIKNPDVKVCLCFDNDAAGEKLTQIFQDLLPATSEVERLKSNSKDWNDDLMGR